MNLLIGIILLIFFVFLVTAFVILTVHHIASGTELPDDEEFFDE